MIYAQIKNGIIQNTILLDDETLIPIFSQNFDNLIRVDNISPQPGIGWAYDGENFIEPEREENET